MGLRAVGPSWKRARGSGGAGGGGGGEHRWKEHAFSAGSAPLRSDGPCSGQRQRKSTELGP